MKLDVGNVKVEVLFIFHVGVLLFELLDFHFVGFDEHVETSCEVLLGEQEHFEGADLVLDVRNG